MPRLIVAIASLFALVSFSAAVAEPDPNCRSLGSLGAFAEMVSLGVKELALGSPMPAPDLDATLPAAREIADSYDVLLYREGDFLVTDLYPANVTEGLDVLFIYKGDTLDKYLALKAEKARLVLAGAYEGAARHGIAMEFGRLLSYPDETIERLIEENGAE